MLILATNDDGHSAPGLRFLRQAAADFGDVVVVAPAKNHSGASSSLTLSGNVAVCKKEENFYVAEGTPADCVHLALTGGFLPQKPNLVVSGINNGANMGDDTIYSGTVAAAMEGHLFSIPAIAFSLAALAPRDERAAETLHFETAAKVVADMLARFCQKKLPSPLLLNVNVPDIPPQQYAGAQQTRLGRRHLARPAELKERPANDKMIFCIGNAGDAKDCGFGTDFYAVENNCASITPLTADLTAHAAMGELSQWLSP